MRRQAVSLFIPTLCLIVIIYLLLSFVNFSQFFESLKNTNITLFALALCVILISNACGAFRWSLLMREVKAPSSQIFINAFGIFSIGQVSGLVVPSRIGSYAKVPLAKKMDPISSESCLAAVNAETILDLVYVCLAGVVSMIILSSVLFSSYPAISMVLIGCIILFAGAGILFYYLEHVEGMYQKGLDILDNPTKPAILRYPVKGIVKIYELIRSTREIFRDTMVTLKLSLFTLLFQIVGIFGYYLVILSAHESLPFLTVFAIMTLTFLAGIVSFIPGGLGASDLSLMVLLASQGIPLSVAVNITLLFRIAMYLPIFLIIGIFLIRKNSRYLLFRTPEQ